MEGWINTGAGPVEGASMYGGGDGDVMTAGLTEAGLGEGAHKLRLGGAAVIGAAGTAGAGPVEGAGISSIDAGGHPVTLSVKPCWVWFSTRVLRAVVMEFRRLCRESNCSKRRIIDWITRLAVLIS